MLSTRVDLQRRATGVVLGIAQSKGDRIVAYGTRGLADKRPMAGDTVFDVGSITKVVTALALSDMALHHEVSLDDPAGKYLPPGVTVPSRDGKEITLADLATHTAGLPLRPTNLVSNDPANPYADYTREDLFAFLSSYKLASDPGSHYDYSNVGYGLLGQVLALRAGETYEELVRNRITAPLGMNDTRFDIAPDSRARMAVGYDRDLAPVPHWDMGVLESAGALHSTANDLLKLLDAALGFRKSPLAPALRAMTAVRRPGGMQPATHIALAWNILDDGGREIVWKNGSVGGYRAFIGYDARARLGIVALANAQTGEGADDIALHLLDPNFPVDTYVPGPHKEIPLDPAILDRYVGVYRYSDTDILTVAREGDHLYCSEPGQEKLELLAEGPQDFFIKDPDVQISFDAIEDGRATKAIWHQSGQELIGVRMK